MTKLEETRPMKKLVYEMKKRRRRIQLTCLAGAIFSLFYSSSWAQSLPVQGVVAGGEATISTPSANELQIEQNSQNAIINWQDFSIGQNNSVNIFQPSSSSVLLNRVTSNTPSTIAGAINANGQVFLINPNGIAITETGTVNTGAFVASTLNITNEDFMQNQLNFSGSNSSSSVSNAGNIKIVQGGYAALLGSNVTNSGTIAVPAGVVALGSGRQATLDLNGGFLQVALPSPAEGTLVDNSGILQANGGSILISVAAAQDSARQVVNLTGLVDVSSTDGDGGFINIEGSGGSVNIASQLKADSAVSNGGKIYVDGNGINLTSNDLNSDAAQVNASGLINGGTITINGNNSAVAINNRRINASSENGNGGQVNVIGSSIDTTHSIIDTSGRDSSEIKLIATNGSIDISDGSQLNANSSNSIGGSVSIVGNDITSLGTNINARGRSNGGTIVIDGSQGFLNIKGGELNANATGNDEGQGGSVNVIGKNVAVSGLVADVSGQSKGGAIELTATRGTSEITSGSRFDASSSSGAGGSVSIVGNDINSINTTINARGRSNGGTIVIDGSQGFLNIKGGELNANATGNDEGQGGSVNVIGENLVITGLVANVSGQSKGGTIGFTTTRGSAEITNGSRFDASSFGGTGGSVSIVGNGINSTNTTINARGQSDGGTITINGSQGILNITGGELNANATGYDEGQGGSVNLAGQNLNINNLTVNTSGNAQGGVIGLLAATGPINISNRSQFNANSLTGTGGRVSITGKNIFLGQTGINTSGEMNGGKIMLNGLIGSVNINDVNLLNSSSLNNNDSYVSIFGDDLSLTKLIVNASGLKGGGVIKLVSGNGPLISSESQFNAGSQNGTGGQVNLLSERMSFSNGSIDVSGQTNGGQIKLVANDGSVDVQDSQFNAKSFNGNGGGIDILAEKITLNGSALNGSGLSGAGSIQLVSTRGPISVKNSQLGSSSENGSGGYISLTADDMDVTSSKLDASGYGNGGNIKLSAIKGSIEINDVEYSANSLGGTAGIITTWGYNDVINTNTKYFAWGKVGGDVYNTAVNGNINNTGVEYDLHSTDGSGGNVNFFGNKINLINSIWNASGRQQGGTLKFNADRNIAHIDNCQFDISSKDGTGGKLNVLGNSITMMNANIDASGNSGGGLIDVQAETYLQFKGMIHADAISNGNGGNVTLNTYNYLNINDSEISVRGGAQSGDGGLVQTSSSAIQNFKIDLSAANGKVGKWIIKGGNVPDPDPIPIPWVPINPIDDEISNLVFNQGYFPDFDRASTIDKELKRRWQVIANTNEYIKTIGNKEELIMCSNDLKLSKPMIFCNKTIDK